MQIIKRRLGQRATPVVSPRQAASSYFDSVLLVLAAFPLRDADKGAPQAHRSGDKAKQTEFQLHTCMHTGSSMSACRRHSGSTSGQHSTLRRVASAHTGCCHGHCYCYYQRCLPCSSQCPAAARSGRGRWFGRAACRRRCGTARPRAARAGAGGHPTIRMRRCSCQKSVGWPEEASARPRLPRRAGPAVRPPGAAPLASCRRRCLHKGGQGRAGAGGMRHGGNDGLGITGRGRHMSGSKHVHLHVPVPSIIFRTLLTSSSAAGGRTQLAAPPPVVQGGSSRRRRYSSCGLLLQGA